jgi:predicted nucleotidyltransferase component of viral defense system
VRESNTPFYLTGGTALSRHYYNHRLSDDLDLFVNGDDDFDDYGTIVFSELSAAEKEGDFIIDRQRLWKSENHIQIYLHQGDEVSLRVDFVNDSAPHYGDFRKNDTLGRIDSWENILSNKIASLFRFEAKDSADIWILSRKNRFHWNDIIGEAKTKEAAVDPVEIYNIIGSIPMEELSTIRWTIPIEVTKLKDDLMIIARDIFECRENSLFIP